MLAIAWLLLGPLVYIMAQPPLYGPEYPPPKDVSVSFSGTLNDEQIGRSTGKDITFTNVILANTTSVYWTSLENEVKLSLDGSAFTGDEIMTFSAAESNLSGGLLVWTGLTEISVVNPSGSGYITKNLYSRAIVRVRDNSNQPVPLVHPASSGLNTNTGGAVLVTGSQMLYTVNIRMEVSENGSTFYPHLDYYDGQGTAGENAYSSYDFGFYWENDPPFLETNAGANVDEGDTVYINQSMLAATDVESDPADLLFIVDPLETGLLPAHGTLYKGEEMIMSGDTLTMVEISNALAMYVHDGSETKKDSIAISLVDGDDAYYDDGSGTVFYFPITITPVDDPPTVDLNTGASIDEDEKITITEAMLLTTDPESGPANITYTVDPASSSDFPISGLLTLNSIPINDAGTFTQADIAAGLLQYDHNGTETLNDGFVFKAEDEFGHEAENNGSNEFFFAITINPLNDDPILTKLLTLEIEEGGTGIVGNMLLAASDEESPPEEILFTIDPNSELEEPFYGEVLLNGTVLNDGEGFSMADVNNNKVTYQHDGSEGHTDFFLFNVSDPQGGVAHDGEYTLYHFNIAITNVNDPPTLENPIADHSTKAEESYAFTFPENTFHDPDEGDQLSYESRLSDESDLPDWLTFDGNTRTFNGIPHSADVGTIDIKIVASDLDNMEITDEFTLEITPAVNVKNAQCDDRIEIGPNPFTDRIYIKINSSSDKAEKIILYNLLGDKTVLQPESKTASFEIDMQSFPAGVYFISTLIGKEVHITKLLKK